MTKTEYTINFKFAFDPTHKGAPYTLDGEHYMNGGEFATADVLPFVCKLDAAGRGCGVSLRFCPTNDQRRFLMTSAKPLCSAKFFDEECANCKYNRGEVFEKMVTEFFGQEWTKDNVPFTQAGDIEVNGRPYQIKYERATFCNEKSLANLAA